MFLRLKRSAATPATGASTRAGRRSDENRRPTWNGSLLLSFTMSPWSEMWEIQKPVWLTTNPEKRSRYSRWRRARKMPL